MANYTLFRAKGPGIMRLLMADFGLTVEEAAAILGNIGHECAGFTLMQEVKPLVPGSAGGYGWCQWTGPRRREFEAYCKRNRLDPASDKANYGWLFVELRGPEKAAIPALKKAVGLRAKVEAFERSFERAGIKHYDSRLKYAEIALDAFSRAPAPADPHPPKEPDMAAPLATIIAPALIDIVGKAIDKALTTTATNPGSPVPEVVAAPEVKRDIKAEVLAEVAKAPEVQHATNSEPWYLKRSRWAAIIGVVATVAAPLATKYGLPVDPATQDWIVTVCTTIGGLWAAYLAYRAGAATRPLGA